MTLAKGPDLRDLQERERNVAHAALLEQAAGQGISTLLALCGQPMHDGIRETPARVVAAYREMTRGYAQDPGTILTKRFLVEDGAADVRYDELVIVRDIPFVSLCEHHLLPFQGTVAIGYLPRDLVVGLSKLARLVDCYACRFQLQERLTAQIAGAIEQHLAALAVGVIVRAEHLCMACRGIKKPGCTMVTSQLRGRLRTDSALRSEFVSLTS